MSDNSFRLVSAGKNFLSPTDFIIQVDTSAGAVELVMPKITTILDSFTTIYQYIGLRFVDVSNNASVNNITLTGFETDTINGVTNIILNTNGVGGSITLIGTNQWAYVENKIATNFIPATNYGLYAQTSISDTIVNSNLETSIIGAGVGTLSVPPNSFSVGDSFVAKIGGEMTNLNGAEITFKVKSLGVILVSTGLIELKVGTNQVWQLDINFTIRQIGEVGVASIISNGAFFHVRNNNSTESFGFNTINNTNFDTTIINTLDITAQWQSASNSNSIHSDFFVLNKVY
jgi:hypothetical protein